MICAECGHEHETPVESCAACGKDPLLDGRYRLQSVIGQGAFGTTWRGERVDDGLVVCLKELLYQRLASFEPEEQFRREAAVLRQLDLPGVPDYVDDFTIATGRAVSLFLVQELVDGETLADELEHKRYREEEVLDVLEALLHILADLHTLSPPVVHRDIKPTNVMRRKDGSLVLIDFGAVKDVLNKTRRGGPSVAGTIGFMAPEQLTGHAEPATDLFGAGALAVALLSRRDPADLLDHAGRLDWKSHVSVSPHVESFLDRLLQPKIDARPESAQAALEALDEMRRQPEEAPKPAAISVPEPTPALPAPVAASSQPARTSSAVPMLGVGIASLVAVGGAVALFLGQSGEDRASHADLPRYTLPQGILELELGATLDEAKTSGNDVAAGTLDPENPFPWPSWNFSTTVAGQIARCKLDFATEETLSRIACDFEKFSTVEGFNMAADTIKGQLEKRYQLPLGVCVNGREDTVGISAHSTVACHWSDATGSLSLEGRFEDFNMGVAPSPAGELDIAALMRTSELQLSLSSNDHARKVADHEAAEERALQGRIDAAAAERRAREEAERRRLEAAGGRGI
mgnify:CR=1 FL=1